VAKEYDPARPLVDDAHDFKTANAYGVSIFDAINLLIRLFTLSTSQATGEHPAERSGKHSLTD
jgi:hypothetical protein